MNGWRQRMGALGLLLLTPVLAAGEGSATSATAVTPAYRAAPAAWQRRIEKDVDAGRVPGALLLVQSPEWGLCLAAAGKTGPDNDRPMQPDQPFRAGAVTRTMVATALLQMEREQKIPLDRKMTSLFGDGIHPKAEPVTLRDCLRMASGFFDYKQLPAFAPDAPIANDSLRYEPEQLLHMVVAEHPELVVDPGTYAFSATDYILAGMTAEKVDGKPLTQILQERVFSRCAMTSSWLDTGAKELPANLVHGYTNWRNGERQDRTNRHPSADWAAGAVISTPADLLKFWQALFASTTLLEPHSYARMTKFITDYNGRPEDARGLGLMERLSDRGTFRGIDGTIPGYYTCMGYYLHRNTYILLFINTSDTPWVGRLMFDNILRQISGAPNRMRPADGAETPAGTVTLHWSAGLLNGQKYAVYVGDSFEEVSTATPENLGKTKLYWTDKNTYEHKVEGLTAGKDWFWRVDAVRDRPDYELKNDRHRYESMLEEHPELEFDFVPEQETIQGPTFRFTTR